MARFYCLSWFVCLFVCLEIFVPLENFSFIWRSHHCRWRAANFLLCSALMDLEQWGFFSVPHLLWHGASVNGRLRGPVTNTFCWAFSSGAVTTCLHDLGLSWLIFEHPTFRLRGERSSPVRHRRNPPPFLSASVVQLVELIIKIPQSCLGWFVSCYILGVRGGVLEVVVIDKLVTPFSEQLEIQNTVGWDSYNTDQGVTS